MVYLRFTIAKFAAEVLLHSRWRWGVPAAAVILLRYFRLDDYGHFWSSLARLRLRRPKALSKRVDIVCLKERK